MTLAAFAIVLAFMLLGAVVVGILLWRELCDTLKVVASLQSTVVQQRQVNIQLERELESRKVNQLFAVDRGLRR